jgi:hypothetical protein
MVEQHAYIKIALQGRNTREYHSELSQATVACSSIFSLQYGYFDVGMLF